MRRRQYFALSTILGLALTGVSAPALADPCDDFSDVVLFATNSIRLSSDVTVASGNVVANDDAGAGPTLSAGGTFEVYIDKKASVVGNVSANRVKILSQATVGGTVFYRDLLDNSGTVGGSAGGLTLPVFNSLPPMFTGPSNGPDVSVGVGGSQTLTPGDYGDIFVDDDGVLTLGAGRYNVKSIDFMDDVTLSFQGLTEIRVADRIRTRRRATINATGSGVGADEVVFYVNGINGADGALGSTPVAARIGSDSTVNANFFVPNGTLRVEVDTVASGAFLARDVQLDRGVQVNLATFFFNRSPFVANPIADVAVDEDAADTVLDLSGTFDDPDILLALQTLALSVTSNSNPGLVTATLSGTSLTLDYQADQFGTATIDVTAIDDGCPPLAVTDSFDVTVASVNDEPSFVKGPDQVVDEDAPAQSVTGWATGISPGPANESGQTVSFSVTNDNNGLFASQPAVDSGGALSYTPAPDAFGSATVSVTAIDDGGTANGGDDTSDAQTFTITVTSVNDQPVAMDDSASTPEETQVTVDLVANDSAGPANELATLTLQPLGGTGLEAEIVGNQLVYTPPLNFTGDRVFNYTVCDSGDGADDPTVLCDSATAVITVTPVNDAPTADPQDLFATATVTITLTGSDPDGDSLTFTVTSGPATGTLGAVTPIVPPGGGPTISATVDYTPDSQLCGGVPLECPEDVFTFQVSDGSLVDTADVTINPGGDPTVEPPDLGEVKAQDRLCQSTDPVDCSLETLEDTPITLILKGAAPCDPTGAPNPAQPCDGLPTVADDVPLTFSLPSTTTSQGGTLSGLNQGTGELKEPPGADEVPQRTAHLLYTPPTGFTGVDSFTFDVEGDVDGSGGIGGAAETDSATVEISVQAFTPKPPVVARDQRVSTPKDTPVDIFLSGSGACQPGDPDCRPALVAPPASFEPASAAPTKSVVDDAGAPPSLQAAAHARRSAASRGGAPKVALAGEELYAIDSDLDQLFELNPVDASSTLVGSTAAGPTTPASLAFDGTSMYTIDLGGGGLYTLNLNTGAPTLICSTGISGWQGLASDPTDEGQFYGITQSDDLYKIDRTTCTTTRVNATAGTVGGLITALEFDSNGTLWGAEFGSPGSTTENAALVTIDKATGAVTVVSQCATRPCSGSDNFADGFQGIDFSTDGTLYGQNTNDDSLYIIDTTDGSLTLLGSNSTIFVKGLAFSEEVLLEASFTIFTLPAVGTLSYLDPLTGVSTAITAGDLPLKLVTEQVTYTPPTGVTGDPLASFTFELSDGITSDTGTVELVVTGEVLVVDPCVEVGRQPGCTAGAAAEDEPPALVETFDGPSDGLTFIVEGRGTVASSPVPLKDNRILTALICSDRCTKQFPVGSSVSVFARPDPGSEFVGWGGACQGEGQIGSVWLAKVTVCTATFREKPTD